MEETGFLMQLGRMEKARGRWEVDPFMTGLRPVFHPSLFSPYYSRKDIQLAKQLLGPVPSDLLQPQQFSSPKGSGSVLFCLPSGGGDVVAQMRSFL